MAQEKKSLFRRISNWLHLWLGLASGIVVFVVCFTAAIWTFSSEISYYFMTGQRVMVENKPFLKPSSLIKKGKEYIDALPNGHLSHVDNINYRGDDMSIYLVYGDSTDQKDKALYLNPYSGEVLHLWSEATGDPVVSFNQFLRSGHRFFWLPRKIGSPFVGSCCIIFLITLITGLIWWYPTRWSKSIRNKSFKIKWGANWKRVNIDLHNVLGFYTLLFTAILTITGIVFTFKWFEEWYYALLTGGKPRMEYPKPGISDTTIVAFKYPNPDDEIWKRYFKEGTMTIQYPHEANDIYRVYINPKGHNQTTIWYGLDQKTLKVVGGRLKKQELSLGQEIYAANLEIHVGTIGGLPTKILASLASLIGASLPITGFIIWYNRKWGKKKKVVRKKVELT